jgi:glutamate/tyrosine decarboxylase-like PLP-dependent enzyme
MSEYPYAERYPVNRRLPEQGRPRQAILDELATIAAEEDATWADGRISGTIYSGDADHYAFLTQAYGHFAHVNALQRDLCPSMTRFEGEIIAMVLDLMHGEAITAAEPTTEPGGLVTTGGSSSILHALLAYREHARATRGITAPNVVKPETAHAAFDKGCHLFGIEPRTVPVDPATTLVRPQDVAAQVDENTIAIIGSAGSYPYGTVDPIGDLAELALARGVGLHVDACLGGFILAFAPDHGYDLPPFDFRVPGVSSISIDTHKYGYAPKGSSVLLFRDKALRTAQYFHLVGWSGGKYMSPGMDGSRSGGLLAATWAALVQYGREGYRRYAGEILSTARALMDAVTAHPELHLMGEPTFCFSFSSKEFDIYHVADFMRPRGWRFNGQQYPNAIHLAVTRPQTRPGVVQAFTTDLAEAVEYAKQRHADGAEPELGAIYGGVAGGMTPAAGAFITAVMTQMLDAQLTVPSAT